jgi:hypothetical protein
VSFLARSISYVIVGLIRLEKNQADDGGRSAPHSNVINRLNSGFMVRSGLPAPYQLC